MLLTTTIALYATRPRPLKLKLELVFGLTAVTAFLVALKFVNWQGPVQQALRWIDDLGSWGPLTFILIYTLACVLFIPGLLLTLGAGVLFGVVRGTIIVSISSTLGATAAFLVARYAARDWVARKIEPSPGFKAVDEAVAAEGWKIVGLLRLSPAFPFSLLNYALGLTRVSFRDYFFASWLGMLPGTLMYVYLGSVIGDLGKLEPNNRSRSPLEWVLYALGLAATVLVTTYVARLARRMVNKRIKT
jgi:uncharacterized membrane protein YdjX (TVP38/TMEM64 family)